MQPGHVLLYAGGLLWGMANPYVAYPVSGLGLLLLMPGKSFPHWQQEHHADFGPCAMNQSCDVSAPRYKNS